METNSLLKKFATPLMAENTFIKASFGGFAGTGKTRTATELIIGCYADMNIKKPLLIIDNEKGGRFLIPHFQKAGIEVYLKETSQLADIHEAFTLLNSGEVGFLFVDSLSKVWYQFVKDYKKANNKTFMTLQDWGKILPDWQEKFSNFFVELNGNCVFTGRGGYTYEKEEDTVNEQGKVTAKGQFAKSGVKMKLAGETPFEPDLNIWMELQQEMKDGSPVVWREMQIMKDRSGLIDGKTFKNPTYQDFQPVIKFLTSMPTGSVAKESNTTNMASSENYEWQNKQEQRELLNSEIKGLFELNGIGAASAEDKQVKATIFKKVFNTTAPETLKKLDLSLLKVGRDNIESILSTIKEYTDKDAKLEAINGFELKQLPASVDDILA